MQWRMLIHSPTKLQVVQCPSCGICYKVTQKRQLLSLVTNKASAIAVSPITRFWCTFWAVISIGFFVGETFSRFSALRPRVQFQYFQSQHLQSIHNCPKCFVLPAGGMSFLKTEGMAVTTGYHTGTSLTCSCMRVFSSPLHLLCIRISLITGVSVF